jgi:Mg2+/citrate symporter
MLELIIANKLVIVTALLAVSEVLALVPGVKSNSIFQLVFSALKKVKEVISAPFVGK